MKRTWKRILKFIIESTAVILIIYGVFSAGAHIKAKKDAIKQQEVAQTTDRKIGGKNSENVSKIENSRQMTPKNSRKITIISRSETRVGVEHPGLPTTI